MNCVQIIQGDCREVLKTLPHESIDACVTDPPYGIGFMGKEWDTFKANQLEYERRRARKTFTEQVTNPNLKGRIGWMAGQPISYDESLAGHRGYQTWTEQWAREVYRVLKPGAYVLCCGAPRSYHRMACGIEDAGFEVRDAVLWLFGQGFPKSKNLGGELKGWGTALKPAWEPILVARKPLIGTVADNVERFGTGALHIDACRVAGAAGRGVWGSSNKHCQDLRRFNRSPDGENFRSEQHSAGRWPANLIHDGSHTILEAFSQFGNDKGAAAPVHRRRSDKFRNTYGAFNGNVDEAGSTFHADSGTLAIFFYCAKASRADRDDGMSGFEKQSLHRSSGHQSPGTFQSRNTDRSARNCHPTVKPTELMRYLCVLITPPGGTVLDPFMGSGSTGRGAMLGGFNFLGIEQEAEYVDIARARIRAIAPLFAEVEIRKPVVSNGQEAVNQADAGTGAGAATGVSP